MRPTSDHSVAHLPDDNDVACSDLATCGPHSEQSAAKVFVDVKDNASSLFIFNFIYLFVSFLDWRRFGGNKDKNAERVKVRLRRSRPRSSAPRVTLA